MGATGGISNKILECLLRLCCSLLKWRANVKAFAAGESHLQPSTGPPPEPQTDLAQAEILVLASKHGASAVQRELGICTQLKLGSWSPASLLRGLCPGPSSARALTCSHSPLEPELTVLLHPLPSSPSRGLSHSPPFLCLSVGFVLTPSLLLSLP